MEKNVNKAKVFAGNTDNNNSMANTTNIKKETKMSVKIYIDGMFFGWGDINLINSYHANGWTVELDVASLLKG